MMLIKNMKNMGSADGSCQILSHSRHEPGGLGVDNRVQRTGAAVFRRKAWTYTAASQTVLEAACSRYMLDRSEQGLSSPAVF